MSGIPPLPERLRPRRLSDIVGQKHLLGKGKPLTTMVERGQLKSLILWGPAGTGKTTIARLLAKENNSLIFQLNAVSSGVKDLREVFKKADNLEKPPVLFIDEIHRFNRSQQDALLEAVEKGKIILFGATTENPSFILNPPLLSRVHVFRLEFLSKEDLDILISRAIDTDIYISSKKIEFIDRDTLINLSGGDARILLNALETAVNLSPEEPIRIDKHLLEIVFQKSHVYFDKSEKYNLMSAFIKSIRGSDPDAAVYYLARMLEGGEDPVYIARRLIILASEDVGNAEPYGLTLATSCLTAVQNIGMPEAKIILSQVATFLASCPKSNSSYIAIEKALDEVRRNPNAPIPLYLRNPSSIFNKKLGYGKGYKYPHSYEEGFVKENYLPEYLKGMVFYNPTDRGRELKIKERLQRLWKGYKNYK